MLLLIILSLFFSEISLIEASEVIFKSEKCRKLFTKFPVFEQAMERVQSMGITSQKEYQSRYKELGLPSSPEAYYKSDWQGYGHFLGTGRVQGSIKKAFPSFAQAMELVQSTGITGWKEYQARYKELGLPSHPDRSYKSDWQDIGHFLGTKAKFPSFDQAMEIVQLAGIKSVAEYKARYKELGLPSNPDKAYKSDWQFYGHFLGTGRGRGIKKAFPSFAQAMELVQSVGITGQKEYWMRYKELGLPAQPNRSYKEDWQGYGHFLGTGRGRGGIKKDFPPFHKAMKIVQLAGIKKIAEYQLKYKALALPSTPNRNYKSDWQGYGHFLGTGRTKEKDFPSFDKAMEIAQSAGIKTQKEYQARYKELGLPSKPHIRYEAEWQGIGHFLGSIQTTEF